MTVTSGDGTVSASETLILPVSPAVFSLDSAGLHGDVVVALSVAGVAANSVHLTFQ